MDSQIEICHHLRMVFKLLLSLSMALATDATFRFHLPTEPVSLDPATATSSSAYLFGNIYRGLYRYETTRGLIKEGAKSCDWSTPTELICDLNVHVKWSDGHVVTADDYVQAWRHLLTAKSSSSWTLTSLRNIKGSMAIFDGQAKPETLGIAALSPTKLKISLVKKDPEFLYRLAYESLVPTRVRGNSDAFKAAYDPLVSTKILTNGPYQISSWIAHQRLHLSPNRSFSTGRKDRPDVEILFVDDDLTALNLYESGTLSLLKRLPTTQIAKMQTRADYQQIPLALFDYVGFGEDLARQPELRKALSVSADFGQLQRIFHSEGQPGCPALPESYLDHVPCLKFDPAAGKSAWAKVPIETRAKTWPFLFSALGGEDHVKGAEWWQAQWKSNLGAKVELRSTEQGVLISLLHTHPPAIFRKGVTLDRPTCLAALELFARNSPENYVGMNDPAYDDILNQMENNLSSLTQKRLCRQGVELLMQDHRLIPLGRYSYAILARPQFGGWTINELNQLSLDDLHLN